MEDNQITDNDKEDDKQDRIELVQRAVEGDKEAFTNLYTLTYSEVYHIVKVFIHNEDTAQDIVQETYYKSLRKIKQLKEPDKFPVWIKKIAVNTAKAHLRKVDWVLFSEADGEGGKSIAELQDERLEHIPEIVVDQAETKKLIDQILGELDEKQRMVVGMFYYEQMSVNEIAEALNCSVNTVKSRLNYARKKIGKEIAELEKKGVILRTAAPIPILMYDHQQGGSREEVLAQHAEKHHEDDEDDEGAALQECHYKVVFIVLFLGFHLVAPLLIQAVASAILKRKRDPAVPGTEL